MTLGNILPARASKEMPQELPSPDLSFFLLCSTLNHCIILAAARPRRSTQRRRLRKAFPGCLISFVGQHLQGFIRETARLDPQAVRCRMGRLFQLVP